MFKVQQIKYSVGSKLILHDVDANFATGQFHVLAGPNGAGKIGMSADNEHKLLLLDEAVSSLDVQYQHQLLQQAKSLCAKGITVVAILHELNLALQYADQLFFMNHGRISAQAANAQAVTSTLLQQVFGVPMQVLYTDEGRPVVFVR